MNFTPPASSASKPPAPEPADSGPRRPNDTVIVVVPVLLVLITFLFWYQTWFGRRLSDRELQKDLTDTAVPHKTQHALAQLAERLARGDTTARRWYPEILRLAGDKEPGLRLMTAWVMGQDNKSEEFHRALLTLVHDNDTTVRWNAALALARFGDATGEPELRLMLRPYILRAPQTGTITFRLKEEDTLRSGSVVARIRPSDGREQIDVCSPLAGQMGHRMVTEGSKVATGESIAVLTPREAQIWESLRGLYLVGQPDALQDVEHFARKDPGMSDRVQQQAALTAEAIRRRAAAAPPVRNK